MEFNIIKSFQFDNLLNRNNIDGEYWKIKNDTNIKNITIHYDETFANNNDEIVLDIAFRFNFHPKTSSIKLLTIKNLNENLEKLELIIFNTGYRPWVVIEISKINKTIQQNHNFYIDSAILTDSLWHRLQISFSSELMQVWVDCNSVLKESINETDILSELFQGSKSQEFTLFSSLLSSIRTWNKRPATVDLKQLKIIKRKFDINYSRNNSILCSELYTLNNNKNTLFDLTSTFERKYIRNSTTGMRYYYRFNEPIEKSIHVPKPYLDKENLKNFTFHIIFRHNGNIEGQMTLLKLENFDEHSEIQSININSGNMFTYIWENSYFLEYQHTKANIKNVDVYDGNWHSLQIDIIITKEPNEWLPEPYYNKNFKFYLDCDLIGEDNLRGHLRFNSQEIFGTFFENNSNKSFTEFDIMHMEMKDNFIKFPCHKIY